MKQTDDGWLVEHTDGAIIMDADGKLAVITPVKQEGQEFVPTNGVIMTALAAYFSVHDEKVRDWFVQNKKHLTEGDVEKLMSDMGFQEGDDDKRH